MEGSRVPDSRLRGEAPAAPAKQYCALSREGTHLFEFETLSFFFFVIVAAIIFLQDPISLFTKHFSVLKALPSTHASFSPQALA